MTVDDVLELTKQYLETELPQIPWYSPGVTDEETLGKGSYGVLSCKGPYETGGFDWNIGGISKQPFRGQIQIETVAYTPEAMREVTNAVFELLRGWSPGSGVSAFTTELTGPFDPSNTKWKPSLYVRYQQFNFTSGL